MTAHLPWAASAVVTGPAKLTPPHSLPDLPGFFFQCLPYQYGGYEAHAWCVACLEQYRWGGLAGERYMVLWAANHRCSHAVPDSDEDTRLFR